MKILLEEKEIVEQRHDNIVVNSENAFYLKKRSIPSIQNYLLI